MKRFPLSTSLVSAAVLILSWVGAAQATVTTTGDVEPGEAGTQPDPWVVESPLYVGRSNLGTLNVEGGGVVSNSTGHVGFYSGSTGTATVTGEDSRWNNSGTLHVGREGDGIMTVEAGGVVADENGHIGRENGSTGTVTITGQDSRWENSGALWVSAIGDGTLNVVAGGVVTNTEGTIGVFSDSLGVVTVTGSDSKWNNSSQLIIANTNLSNGTLNVAEGGMVSNTTGSIGNNSGSTGVATVTGPVSHWNNSGELSVGRGGTGTLNIQAGGLVSDSTGNLGSYAGSTGTATVTDAGSRWNTSGTLHVGNRGGGTLKIEAGGVVADENGHIGRENGSTGTAMIAGEGSRWENSAALWVGAVGHGTMNVAAGGVVTNTEGTIGVFAGSTGIVTVTGSSSKWNNSAQLIIANSNLSNGTLNIENGGLVTVDGTTLIGTTGAVNLNGGRFEFGQTSFGEFDRINATSGALEGRVNVSGTNDNAAFAALQNPAVNLSEVAVVLDANSTVLLDLAGTSQYDQLVIPGHLDVGGQLTIELTGEFEPDAGNVFDILDFGTLSGSFAAVNLPVLDGGLAWDTSQLLLDGSLCAGSCVVQTSGDYNGDDVVDAADYTIWQDNLGGDSSVLGGNGSGAPTVVQADYELWKQNFGNSSTGIGAAIPEPSAAVLALAGLVGLVVRRRSW